MLLYYSNPKLCESHTCNARVCVCVRDAWARVCVRVPARVRVRGSFPCHPRSPRVVQMYCDNQESVTTLSDGGSIRCPYCAQADRGSASDPAGQT